MSVTQAAEPTEQDCDDLLRELNLTDREATVGIGAGTLFVVIYRRCKKPALAAWRGWPVSYNIGGGVPRALGAN